ncbi:hypothetical protein [Selenomonas sputigena]|uniref:LPD3 domain-containing protein n=1 Tax=Selenomonas sputigena TaxID=69823 RepID=UPI0022349CDD|nr:hypothetical protein [Selenomonas sputigena]UZE45041.1 hypothetical protein OL236_10690 [Selenomonas sputigena]
MPAGKTIRTAAAYSIESLLRNAVLIETVHNTKTAKKPSVHAYHRLYVPVKTKNTLVTVRLVMEEQIDGHVTIPPYEVNLYDIIIEDKKKTRPRSGLKPVVGVNASPDTITIREMLAGVKDADGKTYYQQAWHGAAKEYEDTPWAMEFAAHTTFERREEKDGKEEKKAERKEAAQRYTEDYEEAAMAR